MFNYPQLIQTYAGHQGYTLGLEAYHRLKGDLEKANHYSKLSNGFSSLVIRIKNRAEKNKALVKRVTLNEIHEFGIIQGKIEASQMISKNH